MNTKLQIITDALSEISAALKTAQDQIYGGASIDFDVVKHFIEVKLLEARGAVDSLGESMQPVAPEVSTLYKDKRGLHIGTLATDGCFRVVKPGSCARYATQATEVKSGLDWELWVVIHVGAVWKNLKGIPVANFDALRFYLHENGIPAQEIIAD